MGGLPTLRSRRAADGRWRASTSRRTARAPTTDGTRRAAGRRRGFGYRGVGEGGFGYSGIGERHAAGSRTLASARPALGSAAGSHPPPAAMPQALRPHLRRGGGQPALAPQTAAAGGGLAVLLAPAAREKGEPSSPRSSAADPQPSSLRCSAADALRRSRARETRQPRRALARLRATRERPGPVRPLSRSLAIYAA